MTNTSSYRSNGLEISNEGPEETRVEEVLDYVAPGEVYSSFKTTVSVNGLPFTQTALCPQTLVIVASQTRYEFCEEEVEEGRRMIGGGRQGPYPPISSWVLRPSPGRGLTGSGR